jgi:hypothetical protein
VPEVVVPSVFPSRGRPAQGNGFAGSVRRDACFRWTVLTAVISEAEIAAAAALLRPGIYLEPFGRHSLGAVRGDELLIERAVDRFTAMGLEWHAEQSRKLLAPA